jgi:hypothetical protein
MAMRFSSSSAALHQTVLEDHCCMQDSCSGTVRQPDCDHNQQLLARTECHVNCCALHVWYVTWLPDACSCAHPLKPCAQALSNVPKSLHGTCVTPHERFEGKRACVLAAAAACPISDGGAACGAAQQGGQPIRQGYAGPCSTTCSRRPD